MKATITSQKLREGEQKMSGKKCLGNSYEFIVGKEIGHGGNGSVHLVNNLNPNIDEDYAHRDIKVDNLLVLNKRLKLADFGLIWNIDDSRMTNVGERIGPYYIGPPELENIDLSIDDFRPSDVYLFSKLVWEIIKNDFIGFRGEYKRDNEEFYLNPKAYGINLYISYLNNLQSLIWMKGLI